MTYQQYVRDGLNPFHMQVVRFPGWFSGSHLQDPGHEKDQLTHPSPVRHKRRGERAGGQQRSDVLEDESCARKA